METPADSLNFSFSKLRLAALAIALVLLLATSFAGGVVTALVWQSRQSGSSIATVASPIPHSLPARGPTKAGAANGGKADSAAAGSADPAEPAPAASPAATASADPAPGAKAETAPAKAASAAKAPAPLQAAAAPPKAPSSELQLAIIVGSFLDPANADRVEADLRALGLEPQRLTRRADAERTWHAVRLGPYADWESATRFAAQVRLQTGAAPAIRPYN